MDGDLIRIIGKYSLRGTQVRRSASEGGVGVTVPGVPHVDYKRISLSFHFTITSLWLRDLSPHPLLLVQETWSLPFAREGKQCRVVLNRGSYCD